MARFLFIRHAEADTGGTYCGRTDAPLSPLGREQAELAAGAFSHAYAPCSCSGNSTAGRAAAGTAFLDQNLALVASSPLQRCAGLARKLAAACQVQLEIIAGLAEIDFGAWEGLRFDEASQKYPATAEALLARSGEVSFPGGESLPAFAARVAAAWHSLRARHLNNQRVAVIAHAGVIAALILAVERKPLSSFWDIRIPHATLTVIDADVQTAQTIAQGVPLF